MSSSSDFHYNYDVFNDCLSEAVLNLHFKAVKSQPKCKRKSRSQKRADAAAIGDATNVGSQVHQIGNTHTESDTEELADFIEYLSREIFDALPVRVKALTYSPSTQQSPSSLFYSKKRPKFSFEQPDIFEEIFATVPVVVSESLVAYNLISPPVTDLSTFLGPVFQAYMVTILKDPPAWHTTRTSACEICDRDWIPLSYHHLIPKAIHSKALKRGWHEQHMLNKVAWLCRPCHTFVHRMASNEELAKQWHEVDRILEREDVQRWRSWIGTVRWKKQ